jgi:transposase
MKVREYFYGGSKMIRSGLITMIRSKSDQGKSAYVISKEMCIAENTAKKYIRERGQEHIHGLSGRTKGSKLDAFKPYLNELLSQGIFNCIVLLEKLQEKKYDGGITIVKDYVSSFRQPKSGKAVSRYETLPGKQAQMDWGILHYIDENGAVHKTPAFVMIMGSSRAKYVEFTKRCDLYSLLKCMVNAFEYFGGIPETVLTDRMKTVIIRSEAGKPIWNSRFSDFAADIGFVPKVCRPRRPQTKGKVERLVDYLKDNFLPGRVFSDLEDLNNQALSWCRHVDSKIHGTTGEIPIRALMNEPLLSLPAKGIRDKYRWEVRKVTREGLVSFDGAKYGVPWQYSNREVRVRAFDNFFEAYDGEVRIIREKIEYASGKIVWLKGQYQGLAEKGGVAVPLSYAFKTEAVSVEIRSLSVYDEMMGVAVSG